MGEKHILYCYIVYAFCYFARGKMPWWQNAASGGESSAQADRVFDVLYCIWYADHTVYPEHGMYRDTCRRVPSDRIPVVLLKKRS